MKLPVSISRYLEDKQRRKDCEAQILSAQLLLEILFQIAIDEVNSLERKLISPSNASTAKQSQIIGELRAAFKQLERLEKLVIQPSGVVDPLTTKTRKTISWLTKPKKQS